MDKISYFQPKNLFRSEICHRLESPNALQMSFRVPFKITYYLRLLEIELLESLCNSRAGVNDLMSTSLTWPQGN